MCHCIQQRQFFSRLFHPFLLLPIDLTEVSHGNSNHFIILSILQPVWTARTGGCVQVPETNCGVIRTSGEFSQGHHQDSKPIGDIISIKNQLGTSSGLRRSRALLRTSSGLGTNWGCSQVYSHLGDIFRSLALFEDDFRTRALLGTSTE